MHFISARHGTGVGELARDVVRGYDAAMRAMPTPQLTQGARAAIEAHQPPLVTRPAHQAALRASGRTQSAAHHHPRQPDRVGARFLSALPGERVSRSVRPVRHAGGDRFSHRRESLRSAQGREAPPARGRNNAGSTKARLSATPKCRCGPVTRPVAPTAPMTSPTRDVLARSARRSRTGGSTS